MVNKKFKIKIFADGADEKSIYDLNKLNYVSGFTTNPSLMKKAGVANYEKFSRSLLNQVTDKPISFEVFADDKKNMKIQAKKIASWGKNVYVKIPITNSKGESTIDLISELTKENIKCNITAVFTPEQIEETKNAIHNETNSIISVFAGRIADTGIDPIPTINQALDLCKSRPNIEILWASTREILNLFQAEKTGCHIITIPNEILKKFNLIGKDLNQLSLETVQSFLKDANSAGFKI